MVFGLVSSQHDQPRHLGALLDGLIGRDDACHKLRRKGIPGELGKRWKCSSVDSCFVGS